MGVFAKLVVKEGDSTLRIKKLNFILILSLCQFSMIV